MTDAGGGVLKKSGEDEEWGQLTFTVGPLGIDFLEIEILNLKERTQPHPGRREYGGLHQPGSRVAGQEAGCGRRSGHRGAERKQGGKPWGCSRTPGFAAREGPGGSEPGIRALTRDSIGSLKLLDRNRL